ncbi:restriction endonuclease [Escherichia coli]|nr:restriction endonuclease [Escherichia coli]HCC75891.1 restriction endonuclease [Shigella sp.]EFA5252644.1 restriction endonuclease [Escherichia coli]EFC1547587.1 restriction endonuclease [Escherichia coli]EFC1728659.1 restriction endonuclease [Escherichia coli]
MIAIISLPGISIASSKSLQQAIANIKSGTRVKSARRISHCYCYTY